MQAGTGPIAMVLVALIANASASGQANDRTTPRLNLEKYPAGAVLPLGEAGEWDSGGRWGPIALENEGKYYLSTWSVKTGGHCTLPEKAAGPSVERLPLARACPGPSIRFPV